MTGILLAWLVEAGIITWRDFRAGATDNVAGLPLPSDYLATFVIFGGLSVIGQRFPQPAATAAWGYVLATALRAFDPTLNGGATAAVNRGNVGSAPVALPPTSAGNDQVPFRPVSYSGG